LVVAYGLLEEQGGDVSEAADPAHGNVVLADGLRRFALILMPIFRFFIDFNF
jgi:hypothetical protein